MRIGLVGVIVGTLVLLTGWAAVDPHAQIPVVSPIVCSLKGADWTGVPALGIPVACRERTPETTPTTLTTVETGDEYVPPTTLIPETTSPPPDCTREERAVRRSEEAYQRLQDEYDRATDRGDEAAQERILNAQEQALDTQQAATDALVDCQSG